MAAVTIDTTASVLPEYENDRRSYSPRQVIIVYNSSNLFMFTCKV